MIEFRVGEASPANTFFAIWMAEAAGLYKQHGLDFAIVKMVGGSETGPALSSERIHLMHIGMSSVVRANSSGFNVTTIGSLSNVIRSTLFGSPDINSIEDLKGKEVGISSAGSESELSTIVALKKLGLARDDIQFKEIGVERLSHLKSGTVKATMLGEPLRSVALAEDMLSLCDLLTERMPWLYSGLVVDKDYLMKNREIILRFMRATIEGNYLAVSEPDEAKRVMSKVLDIKDPKNLELTYQNFKTYTPLNAEVTVEGGKNILNFVLEKNKRKDIGEYIDETIHEELRDSGFFEEIKNKYKID
ncbi:MAG: ABC transporter substrate-binding protein [Pseudomonadota bacterium]|nr:ABC transporter substrate-binding protein [Pseudomonadota bacterium]